MDKLTEEQKRIKLAEWEGYKYRPAQIGGYGEGYWDSNNCGPWTKFELPNYFHDLNAVAKLEEKMDEVQHQDFSDKLHYLIEEQDADSWIYPSFAANVVVSAKANQRSEAIGITLGLWKEGE